MDWKILSSIAQLEEIDNSSKEKPAVLFKHSTRCSISLMVKNRLDKEDTPTDVDMYYLDLLSHRDISNTIAQRYQVRHESPQVLLIKNGACSYDESHNGISMDELLDAASA